MYTPEQKQIILKNSLGVSYHVFHESGRGLFLRMLGEGNVWSRGYLLSDLAVNDYSIALDQDDIFHFAFQTKEGQILYGHGRHGRMETQLILSSKDTNPWPKHITLLILKDRILCFYMIRYQNRYLVAMQTIKESTLSKPVAIDYIDGPDMHFFTFSDQSKACHLLYTHSSSGQSCLYHRILNSETDLFHPPEKIYTASGDILFPSAVCTQHNQIVAAFQLHQSNACKVMYVNISDTRSGSLYESTYPPGYTGLVYHNANLYAFRVSGQAIYYRSSSDAGEHWTEESLYPFGNGGSLTCFVYQTNINGKQKNESIWELPGNFSGGYKLAFIRERHYQGSKNLFLRQQKETAESAGSPPERSDHAPTLPVINSDHALCEIRGFSGPLQKIEAKTDESERGEEHLRDKDIESKIRSLQNLTAAMKREMTKLWLKQKAYERKLDEFSRIYRYLQRDPHLPNIFEGEEHGDDLEKYTHFDPDDSPSREINEKHTAHNINPETENDTKSGVF